MAASDQNAKLARYRSEIDRLDAKLLRLINQRAQVVRKVGEWKRERGIEVYDQSREMAILSRIGKASRGPLAREAIERIFKVVIQECRSFEEEECFSRRAVPKDAVLRISIVGLGLMGASFALALKRFFPEYFLLGYDVKDSPAYRRKGLGRKLVDRLARDPVEALDADVVILAMPVQTIIRFLKRNKRAFRPGALVMDLGSTKRRICETAWRELPQNVVFIGGHPLAGKATAGAVHADASLFKGKTFVLVPPASSVGKRGRQAREALEKFRAMVSGIGAIPMIMDSDNHDRVASVTSHVPQMISVALALAARELLNHRKITYGASFLEMTRRAVSDYRMWLDIAETNADFVGEALAEYVRILSRLGVSVSRGNFGREFRMARKFRESLGAP